MTHGVLLSVLLDLVGCAIEGTASLSSFLTKVSEDHPQFALYHLPGFCAVLLHPSSKEHCLLAIYFPWDQSRTCASSCYRTSWWHPKRQDILEAVFLEAKKETRGANWRTEPLSGSDLTCCFQNQPYDKQLLYLLPHMAVPTLRIRSGFEGFHFITLTLAHSPDKVILIERI